MTVRYIFQNQSSDATGSMLQAVQNGSIGNPLDVTLEAVMLDFKGDFGGGTCKVKVSSLGPFESPIVCVWLNAQNPDGAAVTTPVISSAGAILLRVPSGSYFTVELTGSTSPNLSVLASGQIKDV
jgi:hypothetical protein